LFARKIYAPAGAKVKRAVPRDCSPESRSRALRCAADGSANEKLYGQKLTAKEIIRDGKVKAPPSASELVALWDKKSPKNAPILSRWKRQKL